MPKYAINMDSSKGPEYLAGLFDGEGCVSTTNQRKCVSKAAAISFRIALSTTHIAAAELFLERYGGYLYENTYHHSQNRRYRKQYRWALGGSPQVLMFVEDVLPYSIIKRPQLEAARLAMQTFGTTKVGDVLSYEDSRIRLLAREKIRQANAGMWDNLEEHGHGEYRYA